MGAADGTGYLVAGDDAGLVSQELSALLGGLASEPAFAGVVVEEFTLAGRDEPVPLGAVLDACRTPPFLAPRRLVVLREGERLDAVQLAELVAYLSEPLESTMLVVAYTGRTVPKDLRQAAPATIDARAGATTRSREEWFATHLARSHVHLDHEAAAALRAHLGEDVARLEGILGALAAAYGTATVHLTELEPFLGTAGGVAPWDLTDALDEGDTATAMTVLARMLEAGARHPLQVLATLHRHYGAMLRLDGEESFGDAEAQAATGLSAFPARKALRQTRRLGHDAIVRAVTLLADADLDLRGRVGWPPELVLEVLVARLAQLVRVRRPARRAR